MTDKYDKKTDRIGVYGDSGEPCRTSPEDSLAVSLSASPLRAEALRRTVALPRP